MGRVRLGSGVVLPGRLKGVAVGLPAAGADIIHGCAVVLDGPVGSPYPDR